MKRKNNIDELFIMHLNEFIEAPITKFDEEKKLKFKDGTLMCNWYKKNTAILKEYDKDIANKLSEERLEFRDIQLTYELEHDPILLQKLEYFKNYENVNKFYLDFKLSDEFGPKFDDIDGSSLIGFWRYYKRFIEKSNLNVCKEIIKQYKSMIVDNPNNSTDYRIKEFISEPSLSKFSKNSNLRFYDGYLMYNFWVNNYEYLIKNSPKVRIEYKKFQILKEQEEKDTKKALENLSEYKNLTKEQKQRFYNHIEQHNKKVNMEKEQNSINKVV